MSLFFLGFSDAATRPQCPRLVFSGSGAGRAQHRNGKVLSPTGPPVRVHRAYRTLVAYNRAVLVLSMQVVSCGILWGVKLDHRRYVGSSTRREHQWLGVSRR